MPQPCQLTLAQASRAMRSGALTSEALVQSCLDNILKKEPEVKAWVCLNTDAALTRARELDRSKPVGLLHGIPIGVKDIIDTRDFPTAYNSAIYTNYQPDHDATIVTRALRAGAIILGKTTTQEFATRGNLSPTRNPHAPDHTPGGSSSGSAAAVAAEMIPLALSSQTAGSIVRPASYCGVVGFKPTLGLIPIQGVKTMAHSLDTLGVHTRSVTDAAIAFQALSELTGLAGVDQLHVDHQHLHPLHLDQLLSTPLTLGICKEPYWHLAEPATREALALASTLLERSGIHLIALSLPLAFHSLGHALDIISDVEGSASLEWEWTHHRDLLSAGVQQKLARGHQISGERYQQAMALAAACVAQTNLLFSQCDAILTPSSPGYAPLFASQDPGDSCFSKLWTILGMPSINLPVPLPGPLPIGLELIGPQQQDLKTLQIAYQIETIFKQFQI